MRTPRGGIRRGGGGLGRHHERHPVPLEFLVCLLRSAVGGARVAGNAVGMDGRPGGRFSFGAVGRVGAKDDEYEARGTREKHRRSQQQKALPNPSISIPVPSNPPIPPRLASLVAFLIFVSHPPDSDRRIDCDEMRKNPISIPVPLHLARCAAPRRLSLVAFSILGHVIHCPPCSLLLLLSP
jgi:hypothetical protein